MKGLKWIASLLCVTVFLGAVLAGCHVAEQRTLPSAAPTPTRRASAAPTPKRVQWEDVAAAVQNWLNGIPCRPPCWEGIVPGQTTISQTVAIVNQLPFVTDLEIHDATTTSSFAGMDRGVLSFNGSRDQIWGSVSYYLSSTVYLIEVHYPSLLLAFQDVIDAYGEPSHVLAGADPDGGNDDTVYNLEIVYIPQGFALVWIGAGTSKPYFRPNWRNFYLYFFEPTLEGYALAYGNPRVTEGLVPWRGMLSFDDYCQGTRCGE